MTKTKQGIPKISIVEVEAMFESVKNWGRWGADDEMGTLNYITPGHVRRAAGLVKSGRSVSMAIPINTVAGPDNQSPAIHHMTHMFDLPIDSTSLRFGMDCLGMSCHGDCHTHIDALCHIAYGGHVYGGRPESLLTSHGGTALDITAYANGIVGRGVLLDIPRLRGVPWLEPGEAVTRAELEECVRAEGVALGEGDILVLRTGHHARRIALGPWDNSPPPAGEGKAGIH